MRGFWLCNGIGIGGREDVGGWEGMGVDCVMGLAVVGERV